AFHTYLTKLEEISRLEIVTIYIEKKPDPASNVLHVLGRTFGKPHKYFYRRYAHRMWTAWEPVNVKIEGDHIVLAVWRGQLHVFWVTFLDKPVPIVNKQTKLTTGITVGELTPDHEISVQVSWSGYSRGEWSEQKSSGFLGSLPATSFDKRQVECYVNDEAAVGEVDGLKIVVWGGPSCFFRLMSRTARPELHVVESNLIVPRHPPYMLQNEDLFVSFHRQYTTENGAYIENFGIGDMNILKKAKGGRWVAPVNLLLEPPEPSPV